MNYGITYRDPAGLILYTERAYRRDLLAFCLGRKPQEIVRVWSLRTGKTVRKTSYWPFVKQWERTLGLFSGETKPVMLRGTGARSRSDSSKGLRT